MTTDAALEATWNYVRVTPFTACLSFEINFVISIVPFAHAYKFQ